MAFLRLNQLHLQHCTFLTLRPSRLTADIKPLWLTFEKPLLFLDRIPDFSRHNRLYCSIQICLMTLGDLELSTTSRRPSRLPDPVFDSSAEPRWTNSPCSSPPVRRTRKTRCQFRVQLRTAQRWTLPLLASGTTVSSSAVANAGGIDVVRQKVKDDLKVTFKDTASMAQGRGIRARSTILVKDTASEERAPKPWR